MASQISAAKKALRTIIRGRLKNLSPQQMVDQSKACAENIFKTDVYRNAVSLCLFISMPNGEIDTSTILKRCFEDGKKVEETIQQSLQHYQNHIKIHVIGFM